MSVDVDAEIENAIVKQDKRAALVRMIGSLREESANNGDEIKSSVDFQMDIVEKILAGETEDEILAAQHAGGTSGKEFVNRPFSLLANDLSFRQSTITGPNAFPFYAVMKVTELATGEEHNITCGGFAVVASLYALRDRGFINKDEGFPAVIQEWGTANGNTRLSIGKYQTKTATKRGRA